MPVIWSDCQHITWTLHLDGGSGEGLIDTEWNVSHMWWLTSLILAPVCHRKAELFEFKASLASYISVSSRTAKAAVRAYLQNKTLYFSQDLKKIVSYVNPGIQLYRLGFLVKY